MDEKTHTHSARKNNESLWIQWQVFFWWNNYHWYWFQQTHGALEPFIADGSPLEVPIFGPGGLAGEIWRTTKQRAAVFLRDGSKFVRIRTRFPQWNLTVCFMRLRFFGWQKVRRLQVFVARGKVTEYVCCLFLPCFWPSFCSNFAERMCKSDLFFNRFYFVPFKPQVALRLLLLPWSPSWLSF